MPKRQNVMAHDTSPGSASSTSRLFSNLGRSLHKRKTYPTHEYVLSPDTMALIRLKQVLRVPVATSLRLSLSPGDTWFRAWYMISAYVPVLTSCIAPIANMMSVVGLIQHWRSPTDPALSSRDINLVTTLNIISLALGIVGNFLFLLNFSVKVTYLITQTISILSWLAASLCLLVAVLITHHSFRGDSPLYTPTEGFWYAVVTCGLYFGCAILLIINFTGYVLRKYPPMFNLSPKERTLMFFTVSYAILSVVGLVSMKHLIEGLTYGSALYYCTVSFLTIGLGDITPQSALAKAVSLILSFCGVMNMGLIVAMIRQTVLSYHGPTLTWHRIERRRAHVFRKLARKGIELSPAESFERMRKIRKQERLKQERFSLLVEMFVFICFWMVGAAVFSTVESWSFYNGVYFCFLCLLTIGYGDFAPKTNFGRVFFVLWAVSAVPLMTVLVSNGGDTLFALADALSTWLNQTTLGFWARKVINFSRAHHDQFKIPTEMISSVSKSNLSDQSSDLTTTAVDGQEPIHEGSESVTSEAAWSTLEWPELRQRLVNRIRHNEDVLSQIYDLFKQSMPLLLEAVEDTNKKYTHEEWCSALQLETSEHLPITSRDPKYDTPNFWLSKQSPLRLPLKEPNYLLMMVIKKLESEMENLLQREAQGLEQLKAEIDEQPSQLPVNH